MSDLLLEYGEMQSPMTYDVLRRKEAFPGKLLHLEGQMSINCCMVPPSCLAISDFTSLLHCNCYHE